jgi:hypothetical protein
VGKTELALNFALKAAKTGKNIVDDLDMVNTYFRLTERKVMIAEAGIHLISPHFVSTNVETLSLRQRLPRHSIWIGILWYSTSEVIRLAPLRWADFIVSLWSFCPANWKCWMFVNVRRPMSGTVDKVLHLMEDMQRNARIPVTGFVNNTNLAEQTTENELRDGFCVLKEAVQKSGIPVAYTTGRPEALQAFLAEGYDPTYIGVQWKSAPICTETGLLLSSSDFRQKGLL